MRSGGEVTEQGAQASVTFLDDVQLTGDYADNTSDAVQLSPLSKMEIGVAFTEHADEAGNTAKVKVLLSDDGLTYEELAVNVNGVAGGGVVEVSSYAKRFVVDGTPGVEESRWFMVSALAKYVKVAVAEIGLANPAKGGQCTVKARLSNLNPDLDE